MSNYINDIKEILARARQKAYSTINAIMVESYWQIGKRIVEQEQHGDNRAAYGEGILLELSKVLTAEFGRGFSYANLRNFRQFYLTYADPEICYTLCSKLTWSHNRLIMRVESSSIPRDFIKDPFVFEFLNLPQPVSATEIEIESALIENLQQFLLELGKGFSFVGRQFRISTETTHFFIDLVFYNYLLKCFVLIDLKAGNLTHQDIGQMDMYRRMFDDLKKPEGDSPTIGIILCTEKSETVVKYSVINDNPKLFATKYMPYLPTESELIAEVEREKRKLNLFREEA